MRSEIEEKNDSVGAFESRKRDHMRLSLSESNQAGGAGFDQIQLIHEALPELDFSDLDISSKSLGRVFSSPFFISSMTAGHGDSVEFNARLARASAKKGWLMGVGSQRRELFDKTAHGEWEKIRSLVPEAQFMGNIGLSQLIETPLSQMEDLVSRLDAQAMIVHLNPLQECLQVEGTPQFRGGIKALGQLAEKLKVPVVVKETGCGIGFATLVKLKDSGVRAVDLSGYGGTHWGRIEGERAQEPSVHKAAADSFRSWGLSTIECLIEAQKESWPFEIWASGGVRSGLDAAKAISLGAMRVGLAQPILKAAMESLEALEKAMDRFEFELKVAMFCTGSKDLRELNAKKVWQWQKI